MADPLYFANNEQVGPPPKTYKKTVQWVGTLKSAYLVVNFAQQGSTGLLDAIIPGWKMKTVRFNDQEYDAAKLVQFDDKPEPNRLVIEVKNVLKNGDNVLSLDYSAPPVAWAGGTAPLTVALYVTAEIAPGVPSTILDIPSLNLIAEDVQKKISDATVPTIAILAIIAAIVIAVAYIIGRVAGFIPPNFKLPDVRELVGRVAP